MGWEEAGGHGDSDPIGIEAEDKAGPPKIKESQFQACPQACPSQTGDQHAEVSREQKVS